MTKYQVTVETKTVYTRMLEFCDGETEEGVRDFLTYQLGDFPELFEDRCIEDNYTDIVAINCLGEECIACAISEQIPEDINGEPVMICLRAESVRLGLR